LLPERKKVLNLFGSQSYEKYHKGHGFSTFILPGPRPIVWERCGTPMVGKEDLGQGALGKIYGAYCQNVNPGPAWFAYSCLYRAVIANTRVSRRREEAECQWKRNFAFQRPAGKVHPALVGEGGVSPGMHTFCKRTAHPCMPFLAK
jgi:hypothetical protein